VTACADRCLAISIVPPPPYRETVDAETQTDWLQTDWLFKNAEGKRELKKTVLKSRQQNSQVINVTVF